MKKIILLLVSVFSFSIFAQESDDDLFFQDDGIIEQNSDDNLFMDDGIETQNSGDDDFFFDDDGIDDYQETTDSRKKELNHGSLFETGSIKVGGKFTTSLGLTTVLYADDDETLKDHIYETTFTPTLSALLSVDARPTQTLRMYSKFGIAYPFSDSLSISYSGGSYTPAISNWFTMKELFTDFSIADRAFFRFGLHTVTWGTGYFFSPVSDMINTSSIDPENTSAQVSGCVNLRTQITFPGTQDCLWFYVIPSTDFNSNYSTETYIRNTALACKGDLVFGGWEIGIGGFYKYENAPKAMVTASGSVINGKVNVFGEAVYQYGADTEWTEDESFEDKTSIFQITCGAMYYWKTPEITVAAQYYYDSNDKDTVHQYFTNGHNIAAVVSFGNIYNIPDLTATVFGMVNIGREKLTDTMKSNLQAYGVNTAYLSCMTFSAMANYSPFENISFALGPYITLEDFDSKPVVSLKLTATIGGGKF